MLSTAFDSALRIYYTIPIWDEEEESCSSRSGIISLSAGLRHQKTFRASSLHGVAGGISSKQPLFSHLFFRIVNSIADCTCRHKYVLASCWHQLRKNASYILNARPKLLLWVFDKVSNRYIPVVENWNVKTETQTVTFSRSKSLFEKCVWLKLIKSEHH